MITFLHTLTNTTVSPCHRTCRQAPEGREAPATFRSSSPRPSSWVINLKTAKSLDLTIPQALVLRADEVIQ